MRIPALDGLRGIAIALVLLCHVYVLEWGWVGVDLFFALSGFLITGILLRTRGRPGYWSRFAGRRARRVLPLYLVLLALVGLVRVAGIDQTPAAPWWMYVTFTANWWFAVAGTQGTPLLHVVWSLCVEEQFYAVWPFVTRWATRGGLLLLCVAVLACSPILRSTLLDVSGSLYVWTPTRLDGLAVGALGALAVGHPNARHGAAAALVAGAVLVAVLGGPDLHARGWHTFGYTGLALLFGGAVVLAAELDPRPLSWWPLPQLGRISFGLYLLHYPAMHFLGDWPGLAASVVLSALSWRYLEQPILDGRWGRGEHREEGVALHDVQLG